MQRQKKTSSTCFYNVSWYFACLAQGSKQKKRTHGPLQHSPDTRQKKESTWLSPTWLRYPAKKQREPGPNRYQATKIEVSLLTETKAKIKILSNSNQTFVEQSLYEQYSAPLPRKEKLYRFWLIITRGHSLQNKTSHVSFAIKVVVSIFGQSM